jgi:hypothetical protein
VDAPCHILDEGIFLVSQTQVNVGGGRGRHDKKVSRLTVSRVTSERPETPVNQSAGNRDLESSSERQGQVANRSCRLAS